MLDRLILELLKIFEALQNDIKNQNFMGIIHLVRTQNFLKTNCSYLPDIHICAYQWVRNVSLSE